MYGTQAPALQTADRLRFENDVKMYGTQADLDGERPTMGLRMM